jgi:CheY-like chemotaxis protein
MLDEPASIPLWPAHPTARFADGSLLRVQSYAAGVIARTLAALCGYASVFRPESDVGDEPLKSGDALEQAANRSVTILLAEDEPAVRSLIRKILQRSGYTVLEACHGTEAIQIAEQHASVIDLLVTDVVMPLISGPQLAQHLALRRPTMKVLYISGYIDNTITRHGLQASSASFLQKPFTPDELVRKVRAVLDAG